MRRRAGDREQADEAGRPAATTPAGPPRGPAGWALALQRTAGNRATGAALARTPAQDLVGEHTGLMGASLDEVGLADALLARLPAAPRFVGEALDAVDWMNRDDVAYEIAIGATDPMLRELAASDDGDRLIRRLAIEMQGGTTVEAEEREVERLMQIVSDVRNEAGGEGGAVAVEVITFTSGHAPFDLVGGIVGGVFGESTRGHTAVVVGGLVYSFENGWTAGLSKQEYLAANDWRSGIGLELGIPRADAVTLQRHLNEAVEEGVYAVGGDICTDATSRKLEEVLEGLDATGSWDVIGFMRKLRATGAVTGETRYPARGAAGAGAEAGATPP